jgi:D(-)-tartrate dehydratase
MSHEIEVAEVPLHSAIQNAWVSFAEMTVSVVVVAAPEPRSGKWVVGYGFNSIGRFAHTSSLTGRFVPRLVR